MGIRLENALTAYAGYLWKMVWPLDLGIFYPLRAPIPWQSLAEAAILLAGISVIVWRERKCSPWLTVGWLWFFGDFACRSSAWCRSARRRWPTVTVIFR